MSIRTIVKLGLIAIALGTAAIAAAPAQAAPPPFSFSLNLNGNGPNYPMKPGIVLKFGSPDYFNYCANDYEIKQMLQDEGWHKIMIKQSQNKYNKVWVIARQDGDWYQLRVDRCTGEVDHVHQIDYNGFGNFSFSLNF